VLAGSVTGHQSAPSDDIHISPAFHSARGAGKDRKQENAPGWQPARDKIGNLVITVVSLRRMNVPGNFSQVSGKTRGFDFTSHTISAARKISRHHSYVCGNWLTEA
jgi:hypothetical protein